MINIWDGENKKRLSQITGYPSGIAALAFSRDGSYMAAAASYTYERGEQEHPADSVFVRQMADAEIKPKPQKQ